MQDVQTDLNVDLIKRSDSLMDMQSPPNYDRRGRGNNKGPKSRSRSPMGAAMGGANYGSGNPYEYARPSSKGRQAKKPKKGKRDVMYDDDGIQQLEVPVFGSTKNAYPRHNSANFDGKQAMSIQQKMKMKKMRGKGGPGGDQVTPGGPDDKDCTIF